MIYNMILYYAELDRTSQEGADGGTSEGPNGGTQVGAEGLSMVEGDQGEEEGQGTGESPDLAVSEMEDYGALDGMKVGICYFFVYYLCKALIFEVTLFLWLLF